MHNDSVEVKARVSSFKTAALRMLQAVEPDRSSNTVKVVQAYETATEQLGDITDTSSADDDLDSILSIIDNIELFFTRVTDRQLDTGARQKVIAAVQKARKEFAERVEGYDLDGKALRLIHRFKKTIQEAGQSKKELTRQAEEFCRALADNIRVLPFFCNRIERACIEVLPQIRDAEGFSKALLIGMVLEKISSTVPHDARENIQRTEAAIAGLLVKAFQNMSKVMYMEQLMRNISVVMEQLPGNLLHKVDVQLPGQWKEGMVLEKPMAVTPSMHAKIAYTNVGGIILKNVKVGNSPQAEVQQLITAVADEKLPLRDVISLLSSRSTIVVKEFLRLADERDRLVIEQALLEKQKAAPRVIRKK